jgi:hypothetical protein
MIRIVLLENMLQVIGYFFYIKNKTEDEKLFVTIFSFFFFFWDYDVGGKFTLEYGIKFNYELAYL